MSTIAPTPAAIVVCNLQDLLPCRGAAALIAGHQIALFRVEGEVFAVQQLDPYSGAQVMSRGIVGTRGDRLTLAGPMYKQIFDLRTGECLDPLGLEPRRLRTWPVLVGPDGAVVVQDFCEVGP
jgi:NAD(P)H-dependent nitrite reductase small subunit